MTGRVLRAVTTDFVLGFESARHREAIPTLGALVRAESQGLDVYGLVYQVQVNDDLLVRQIVTTPNLQPEYIEDQRSNRQVPVEVSALAVGFRLAGRPIERRLPPRPPMGLDPVTCCDAGEVLTFAGRRDYLALILNARLPVASEDLLAAHLGQVAALLPAADREAFLISAGQDMARLLAQDYQRLGQFISFRRGNPPLMNLNKLTWRSADIA